MDDTNRPASSAEPMIPKSRLDELIDRNRQTSEENRFLREQLQRVTGPKPAPEQEDPEMEEIKQSNPTLYKKIKGAELENRRLRAGFSTLADKQDKIEFFLATGNEGKKREAQVEDILARERNNGNFKVNRIGIFNWIRGQERLAADDAAAANPPPAKQPTPPANAAGADDNIPSDDPSAATTIAPGSASANFAAKSREERIKELENVTF